MICSADHWTGFYMIAVSVMKELNPLLTFGQRKTMNAIYRGYVDSFKMPSKWLVVIKYTSEKAPHQLCNSISQFPAKALRLKTNNNRARELANIDEIPIRFFPGDKGICYKNRADKVRIENWQLGNLLEILASLHDKPRLNSIN